jgi:hypothetical protein
MVWQAICSCGQKSKAFVTSKTINSKVYTEEGPQKRQKQILKKTHWTVQYPKSFYASWNNATRKVGINVVQTLMSGIKRKLQLFLRGSS